MSYNWTTFLAIFVGIVFIVVELKLRHPKNKMNHIERGHSWKNKHRLRPQNGFDLFVICFYTSLNEQVLEATIR